MWIPIWIPLESCRIGSSASLQTVSKSYYQAHPKTTKHPRMPWHSDSCGFQNKRKHVIFSMEPRIGSGSKLGRPWKRGQQRMTGVMKPSQTHRLRACPIRHPMLAIIPYACTNFTSSGPSSMSPKTLSWQLLSLRMPSSASFQGTFRCSSSTCASSAGSIVTR